MRGLARFPADYLGAVVRDGGWRGTSASRPPGSPRSQRSLRPASCHILCPHRVCIKQGGFWLCALPGVWPLLPRDPLACPPVQTLRLPGGRESLTTGRLFLGLIPPRPHPPRGWVSARMWVLGNLGVRCWPGPNQCQARKVLSGKKQYFFWL